MMGPARKEPDASVYSGRFAKKIRVLRDESGLTAEKMLERIARFNKSDRKNPRLNAFYGWETGTGAPHLDLLPALAKALKVSIHDLMPKK